MTGVSLKQFLEQKDKLRVIMYYNSQEVGAPGLVYDFEEIAEVFESQHTTFGHLDVYKNDIGHVLGYRADQNHQLGNKPTIVLVLEDEIVDKPPKDFRLVPYEVSSFYFLSKFRVH